MHGLYICAMHEDIYMYMIYRCYIHTCIYGHSRCKAPRPPAEGGEGHRHGLSICAMHDLSRLDSKWVAAANYLAWRRRVGEDHIADLSLYVCVCVCVIQLHM